MSFTAVTLLTGALFAQGQPAAEYQMRPSPDGRFALEVFKTGLWKGRKHLFVFQNYHGKLRFDPASPQNSAVRFEVEGATATCQDSWVDAGDLIKIRDKALELMDVAKHPQLAFSSQRIDVLGADRYQVHGSLEIAGITRPATVSVTLATLDPTALVLTGSTVVRLRDYGLKPPSAALGLIGTQNEMNVEFRLPAKKLQ